MILVTGGAGFIGSNIVKGLNDKGIDNIIITDNLTNGVKHKNLNRLNFIDYIDKLDFNIDEFFAKNKIDVVFHQGACSSTTESDGKYMMKNNYEYTKNMLNACIKYNVRFIYASSASVYGNGDNGFTEKQECEYPLNVYAFSKYQFDRYITKILPTLNIQAVGLRYFNVYGPQENHKGKMASVAYHMFNQIKNGESMKLFEGSENFIRDFIYIDDVVSVNMFFFENKDKSGIFNCGTGSAESFCKIADALQELYKDAKVEKIPFPDNLKGKYQTFTEADITKLREAGYNKDFINLFDGTKKYADILEKTGGYIV